MGNWPIGIAAVLFVALLVAKQPVLGAVDSLARDDTLTLEEGLQQTTDFLFETTEVVERDIRITAWPQSADPRIARQLRNNYSLWDQSDSRRYPGYNDCDSWINLVNDGWSASTGVIMSFENEQRLDRAMNDIQRSWTSPGRDVQPIHDERLAETITGLFTKTPDVT